MNIEYLTPARMQGYLDCVKSLNATDVELADIGYAVIHLNERCSNIITLIGVVDDKVVACATVIMERKLRYMKYCCHIEDVAVLEEYRGKGYGKQIVKNCVDRALDLGCYKIKLNCTDDLVSFYEDIGFQKQGNHMVITRNSNYGGEIGQM